MTREKLLTVAVVVLLLLNLSTIGYLFLQHRHHPPPPVRMDRLIPETIGFDNEQIKQFDALRNDHHSQMVKLDEQNKSVLITYLQLLETDSVNTTQKDSIEKIISSIQQQRAAVTLDHFQKLKAVCRAEQKEKFNALIPELTRVMIGEHRPEPPKP